MRLTPRVPHTRSHARQTERRRRFTNARHDAMRAKGFMVIAC
jgi:hypothetical protein